MTNPIKPSHAKAPAAFLPFAAALLASALLLSACNTAEGIGDDAEEVGEEVGDAFD
jgi:predicted small secreted protein